MTHLKVKKTEKLYIFLFIGLFLYSLFGLLFSIHRFNSFRIPQLIGITLFLIVLRYLIPIPFKDSKKRFIISFFFICQLFILLRISAYNMDSLRLVLFEPLHYFSYLVTLVFFLPINLYSLKKIFIFLFLFSISFVVLHFFIIYEFPVNNFSDAIIISSLPPAGILLLLSKYVHKKIVLFSLLVILFDLIIGLIYGRRSIIVNASLFILFSFNINILTNKKIRSEFKIVTLVLAVLGCVYFINHFIENMHASKYEIFNRIDEDSRSDVFKAFIKDFESSDYILGRGIDGSYYNPMKYWNFTNDDYREVNYRTNIENGFLYMIMKGGLIYLISFLLILLRAIYLGLFKSNNSLVKGLASYLLIYLFDMFVFGQPSFSLKYCLVWICISMCYSKKIRLIPEQMINRILKAN